MAVNPMILERNMQLESLVVAGEFVLLLSTGLEFVVFA